MAANKEFEPESFVMPDIEVKPNLIQSIEAPDRWDIILYVGLPEKTDQKTAPYDFGVSVFGIFACCFPKNVSPDYLLKCKQLFYVNASSMLYSAVRDHLLALTALGPYGPFTLPAYRFKTEDIKE